MTIGEIASPGNERVKDLVKLRTRRRRDQTGTFLVEGRREVSRARHGGVQLLAAFVGPEVSPDDPLLGELNGIEVTRLSAAAFAKAAYRADAGGVVAVARTFPTVLDRIVPGTPPFLLVVEAVEKPGNLGAMLRTAAAAGVDGVMVADPATDLFNPNVVRASLGALFSVPVAVAATPEIIAWLAGHAITVVATSPGAETSLYDLDLTGSIAIAVGSEAAGLSPPWLEAGTGARLPLASYVDSLNAATAAAVCLFEVVRQRG